MTADQRHMLATKGTRAFTLTPSAVIATARKDLGRRDENMARASEGGEGGALRYAFLAQHIRGAESPAKIIQRALKACGTPALEAKLARGRDPSAAYLYNATVLAAALGALDVEHGTLA